VKVLLCDFVGHAFPTELSRTLSRRGHEVWHTHLVGFVAGKGPLRPHPDDPPGLRFVDIDLGAEFPKYHPLRRAIHELRFSWRLISLTRRVRPDIVLLSTTPPIAQLFVVVALRAMRVPSVVWLQDIFAMAMESGGEAALGRIAGIVTRAVGLLERVGLRATNHVVAISRSFEPFLGSIGVAPKKVTIIPNWAALTSLQPQGRSNAWAREHGLESTKVVLYAGTLGFKHDWTALLDLARVLDGAEGARLVVVSEGVFVDRLAAAAETEGLSSLVTLPYQPFERLSEVLASADVCLALLTEDASRFSVPSKVQSYLAVGRPVLLVGPTTGDAANALLEAGAGVVVEVDDRAGLAEAAVSLLADPTDRGERAHRYAQEAFNVDRKADQFELVLGAQAAQVVT
jgi:colanic acid biosynthesis glycosyl transferase WcaI